MVTRCVQLSLGWHRDDSDVTLEYFYTYGRIRFVCDDLDVLGTTFAASGVLSDQTHHRTQSNLDMAGMHFNAMQFGKQVQYFEALLLEIPLFFNTDLACHSGSVLLNTLFNAV